LYEKELRRRGFEAICPDAAVQLDCVMKAVNQIKASSDKQRSKELLFKAGRSLEAKGAQIIVLGCTEIPLAFDPHRASVPVVNPTRVLAEAAIREFNKQSPSSVPR
jgi:aspartate racemase